MKSLRDEILLRRVMFVGRWACSRRKKSTPHNHNSPKVNITSVGHITHEVNITVALPQYNLSCVARQIKSHLIGGFCFRLERAYFAFRAFSLTSSKGRGLSSLFALIVRINKSVRMVANVIGLRPPQGLHKGLIPLRLW